ncbi:MAG TPA: hypothetical protein VFZ21_07445 [Gemmatimonadaceae bacterium]|nr:hypothetical protein [Gemmatimonadaceae bacterium]
MHGSRKLAATRFALLTVVVLAACQDATPPTAPVIPQTPQAARSPVAQARLEAIFQRTSPEVMSLPGTVFADNDEVAGKVVFGVENAAAMNGVRHALARIGVDEADYAIEVTKPIVMAASLRDKVDPKLGGIQIHFTRYLCTLGFNATVGTQRSFITNSHCTATQGGVESTAYYQPTSSTDPTVIATEVDDPPYLRGALPGCPRNKKCRYSDAARAAYSAGATSTLGAIARTSGPNNGSLTITGSFSISGVGTVGVGDQVNKVGRTTGWTQGKVDRTCVNTSVSGSTVYLLCQTFVSNANGATVVGSGDSGSAVFGAGSTSVPLLGILWGGSSDNKTFVFSPFAQIDQELSGTLTVK